MSGPPAAPPAPPAPPPPRTQARDGLISLLLIVVATVVYYQLPVPRHIGKDGWTALFFGGTCLLGLFIVVSIRRLLRKASQDVRIRALLLLLVLTVLFFSWADRSVAELPGQFAQLHTKTDALYFNVSTLATVGFGDVHPTGQLARAAVTLQIVFNLVFLGTAVSMITGLLRRRVAATRHEPGPAAGEPR